jgi:integral membrane sensor domain MASE1
MLGDKAHTRLHRAALAAALAAGFAASVLLSVLVSRADGTAAGVWTANGFLAGAFILLPRPGRVGVAAACALFQAAVDLAAGDGPIRAALYPMINLTEAGLAGWLAIRFCRVRARRLSLRELALVPIGAILPAAAVAGAAGALVNLVLEGQPLPSGWLAWAVPGGLGMAIVLPALLLAARAGQYKEFDRAPLETAAILAGLGALVVGVFLERDLPLQFAIFPALTLIAVRLGPPGAAAAGLLTAMMALPLTLLGPGAPSASADSVGRVQLAELVIATALFCTLITAIAVSEQTRLRQLMLGRDRAARAARQRARRAESEAAQARAGLGAGGEARAQPSARPRQRVARAV